MLIHSCLYYELDTNIVSDHQWQAWANELAALQNDYPQDCNINFYDKEFEGWNGSTGHHLPIQDPWVFGKAVYILGLSQC